MSIVASDFQEILPGVFRWEYFSPEHKVELTSHAVMAEGHLYIFDPIELATAPRQLLLARRQVAAIVLTNENHERAYAAWRDRTKAPVWMSSEMSINVADAHHWDAQSANLGPWEITALPGGAGGESAFRWRERSLVALGDAIFNLPKYGFKLLPEKYCQNQGKLRETLLRLTEEPFETALFAHGAPILTGASARIREMLRT